ncbi:putative uncharacterized protein DDB_G0282133 [Adelges cooleyi]|uniref:putative uncharacterized protein DDB_G0282133 n=1 Tax=Adelges cooleyi TaxID=133065 RepID=UPI00217FDD74|nr:putative uncharacterized protein DDB_G0282133 [Adelges cooleyi]
MINIKIILLLSLTAYVWCSGNNASERKDDMNRNIHGKNNRKGISGFSMHMGSDENDESDENYESEDSNKDYYRPKQQLKPIVSPPNWEHGNNQGYAGYSYNNNQSRKYDYGNRYANRGMPTRTDNVNNTTNDAGKINRGLNVDMTGDNFTVDSKIVYGSSVNFTDDGPVVNGVLSPQYGAGNRNGGVETQQEEAKG